MKYILLIFLLNGDNGGHVAWTQVEFESKALCETAKKEYLYDHKDIRYSHTYRQSKAFCFKVKE